MNVKDILISAGYKINIETDSYYKMNPIYRANSGGNALSVNKKTGFFTDFATGEKGSLEKLILLTTGSSIDFEPDVDDIDELKKEIKTNFNKVEIENLLPSYSFYNKKGISSETLKYFMSGYCSYGKMNDRYVFPIINPDGAIVGLNGRAMRESSSPNWIKWKILGKRTSFVYPLYFNKQFIHESGEIGLVESIGNMLALWECGVKNILVTFGTSLSQKLLAAIVSLNPSKIYVSMDNDNKINNPGQLASDKIRNQLKNLFDSDQIRAIVPPSGLDWSDLYKNFGKDEVIKHWYGNKV